MNDQFVGQGADRFAAGRVPQPCPAIPARRQYEVPILVQALGQCPAAVADLHQLFATGGVIDRFAEDQAAAVGVEPVVFRVEPGLYGEQFLARGGIPAVGHARILGGEDQTAVGAPDRRVKPVLRFEAEERLSCLGIPDPGHTAFAAPLWVRHLTVGREEAAAVGAPDGSPCPAVVGQRVQFCSARCVPDAHRVVAADGQDALPAAVPRHLLHLRLGGEGGQFVSRVRIPDTDGAPDTIRVDGDQIPILAVGIRGLFHQEHIFSRACYPQGSSVSERLVRQPVGLAIHRCQVPVLGRLSARVCHH